MSGWTMSPIGHVESVFKEKFAIPRQPGLSPSAASTLVLHPPYDQAETVRGLEAFSHLWIVFVFHETAARGWRPTIRPPKLGGNRRVGVFASRSTFRPNPIGLSVVQLLEIDTRAGVRLKLAGADLLDGTPVLDIKPYLAYADAKPDASNGYADVGDQALAVRWGSGALSARQTIDHRFAALIEEVLAQDPRPGYADDPARTYGVRLGEYEVRWRVADGVAEVLSLAHIQQN
jgi:tRNA-Thr(GGU) m(6)t(6)A37 methyltransferase TsaA